MLKSAHLCNAKEYGIHTDAILEPPLLISNKKHFEDRWFQAVCNSLELGPLAKITL
jgi:hypothetical protein